MVETFGQRLRRLRIDAGLSQPALARLVPVSQSTLSHYENDHRPAPTSTATRLDELLRAGGALVALQGPAVLHGPTVERDRLTHVARTPRAVDTATLDTRNHDVVADQQEHDSQRLNQQVSAPDKDAADDEQASRDGSGHSWPQLLPTASP